MGPLLISTRYVQDGGARRDPLRYLAAVAADGAEGPEASGRRQHGNTEMEALERRNARTRMERNPHRIALRRWVLRLMINLRNLPKREIV